MYIGQGNLRLDSDRAAEIAEPLCFGQERNTPLVELSLITRDFGGRILAKLDYLNPGGSKKDRIALRMIRDAEASGNLAPG